MKNAVAGVGVSSVLYGNRAIHRYVAGLTYELARLPGWDLRLFSFCFRAADLSALPAPRPGLNHCLPRLPGRFLETLWRRLNWPAVESFTGPLNLFHATDLSIPPVAARTALVLTVHGISYLVRPQDYPRSHVALWKAWLERGLARADRIIAVSQTTREQLEERYPRLRSRVRVVPLGVGREFTPMAEPQDEQRRREWGLEGPYLLYVGALSQGKNLPWLLDTLERTRWTLVLAGPPAQPELLRRVLEAQARGRVRWVGHLPQGGPELPALYRGARALIFPSLSEGWASPPLEAMACGTPVVTSNCSSLPETVGDAALLVDPTRTDELLAAVESVSEEAVRAHLIARGLERAARFTWEACARATLPVYQETL